MVMLSYECVSIPQAYSGRNAAQAIHTPETGFFGKYRTGYALPETVFFCNDCLQATRFLNPAPAPRRKKQPIYRRHIYNKLWKAQTADR